MDFPSILRAYKRCKAITVSLDDITPNPLQPRRFFDKDELFALASSIKSCGLIQPIAVKRIAANQSEAKYEIIAGERRWRACKMAGLDQVPCIVFETDQSGSALMALVENLQRSDLSFFEEALAMQTLLRLTEMPQSELAHSLSISQCTLSNKLRLLRLSERERLLATQNNFSERHCRALVRIDSEQERAPIIQTIISKGLSATETEKLIDSHLSKIGLTVSQNNNKKPMLKGKINNMKLLYNTLDKAVSMLNNSGLDARWDKKESGGTLVVTICVKK
ncbi:MAG: ParB/RepB/Spo0J family partition protein [Clostridia bacterium]|nr:ParB/RepB/Spo0J family partition protein [Clostridia bacterium]